MTSIEELIVSNELSETASAETKSAKGGPIHQNISPVEEKTNLLRPTPVKMNNQIVPQLAHLPHITLDQILGTKRAEEDGDIDCLHNHAHDHSSSGDNITLKLGQPHRSVGGSGTKIASIQT